MDGIAKTFSNPYVLMGGAAIGLVLLMSAHKANGATSGGSTVAPAPFTTAVMAYNTAALGQVTEQAKIAASVATARISADMTKQVATIQGIQNLNATWATIEKQRIQSNEGIINSQITGNTAITVDLQNNMARLGMAQQQTVQTKITTDGQVQIAQAQAKAIAHAADMNAISSVAGVAVKAAAAYFTGGASLMMPSTGGFDAGGNHNGSSIAPPDLRGLY